MRARLAAQSNVPHALFDAYLDTMDSYTHLTVKFSNSVRDAQVRSDRGPQGASREWLPG